MQDYKKAFIQLALDNGVLNFGEFTLKSGRVSPYFFNAGRFRSGQALSALGRCYAAAIENAGLEYDVIFGPAYKGIPLAATTAVALANDYQRDMPFAFNRKEAKTHGEGGTIVGAELVGRILIIDDVITAGTAVREVMDIINAAGARPAAVVIGLNRLERGTGNESAIQQVERDYGIPVVSIIDLNDIISFIAERDDLQQYLAAIDAYREQYGV
ncbi:MAG TPA: orotate phosphoribosyltransferase [Pseudomonadales bacterium]|nr:orotate phosphoribosyltransferase [Pseudomonadales bacterium]